MFKVFKEPCKNCLLTPDRIVSPLAAKQIISDALDQKTHFTCHKASMNGTDVCCSRFFESFGDKVDKIQIFKRLDMVEKVSQDDNEKLIPYKDQNRH